MLSACIAGLVGARFTHSDSYIALNAFGLDFSILALKALIFGGIRSTFGIIVGMDLVVILPDLFTGFKDYRLMVFGNRLLLALFFLPTGLAGLVVVNKLDLHVKAGTIHGLMGPNGSGKSTTVNVITGFYQQTMGQVSLVEKVINKLNSHRRAELGIARTFQNLQLLADLTVLENVQVALHKRYKSTVFSVILGLNQCPSRSFDRCLCRRTSFTHRLRWLRKNILATSYFRSC